MAVAASLVGLGTTSANAAESTTLTIWSADAAVGEVNAYRLAAEAFQKAYPQYNVVFREAGQTGFYQPAVATALQAGNAPDVFMTAPGVGQVHSTVTLGKAGYLMDLSVTKAKTFNPAAEAGFLNVGKKVYGLGLGLVLGTTLYNKTLYEKDGLGKWPTTFADLLKKCAAAQDKGKTLYALAGAMGPNAGISSLTMAGLTYKDATWTAKRLANKVSFSTDLGWRRNLQNIVDMNNAGCFQKGVAGSGANIFSDIFFAQKTYAIFAPASLSVAWGGNFPAGTELRATYIPAANAKDTVVPASTNYALSVNAKTKAPTAAKAFINYMTGAGSNIFMGSGGYIGYGKGATAKVQYEYLMPFVKAGRTYPLPNNAFTNGKVYESLQKGVQGLLLGSTTITKVLGAMDKNW
jgi:raffinose/stachyose/melibiose transport system substrate-binding protein